jgi:serine/threonine protein kinase
MGAVYKARDLRRQEYRDRNPYVAVKVLNVDLKAHADAAVALQREAKKSQKLAHPNILTVYDFDRDGDIVYMTMELLEGEPLQETIKRAGEQGLAVNEALPLVDGMGQALAFAHKQGIVHSDFKPGNVFVGKDSAVKVLDFGIARAINTDNVKDVTQLGFSVALTPAYASCEMLEGLEPDPRDDIFALACITYELLSGRHPFKRIPAVQAHAAGLKPARIKGLDNSQWKGLMHGLAFSRDHRTPSVEQFLSELHSQKLSWAARIFKR